jgi:PTS system mannose-specific IIA component
MMGLLLVTHGGLGQELLSCAEGVIGRQSAVRALGLEKAESPDGFEKKVRDVLTEFETPAGTLILADMLGGTPCNVCLRLARDPRCHFDLVTGVNLPMLVTALANRHYMPLPQLAQKLMEDAARSAQRPLQRLREHLPGDVP